LKFPRHLMGAWAAERALLKDIAGKEAHRVMKLDAN
jgi:hypothetical protein